MFRRRALNRSLLVLLTICTAALSVFAQLQVHFLDVGQAECILLQLDPFTLLIDAGDQGRGDVVPKLRDLGVQRIDLLILTHPHQDHIGQAVEVLDAFEVAEVWMSGSEHYTPLFEQLVDAVLASDAAYYEPRRGDADCEFGNLTLQVLNPAEAAFMGKTPDLHAECLVIRAVFGEVAFLFTGDIERKTENRILQSGLPLQAQILKLAHHGSRSSSSLDFLAAVNPEVAVYSAGRGNIYGHPHPEVLDRLKILEAAVYGTAVHGTVTVETDGIGYQVSTAENSEVARKPVPTSCVDINSADLEALQLIIHIGPKRAKEIMRLRAIEPFKDLDDLKRVSGLGGKRIDQIKEQGLACVKE